MKQVLLGVFVVWSFLGVLEATGNGERIGWGILCLVWTVIGVVGLVEEIRRRPNFPKERPLHLSTPDCDP